MNNTPAGNFDIGETCHSFSKRKFDEKQNKT